MTRKSKFSIIVIGILAITLVNSAKATYNGYGYGNGNGNGYGYDNGYNYGGPTHGWNGQAIRLDYSMGGPNIKINETTGLTVSHVSSRSYKAFGYFTFDANNGAIIEKQEITFDDNGSAYIGQFEKETRIGTWLTTENGTFYSVPSLNESNQHMATYLGDTAEGNLKIGLEGGKKWCGSDYREMVVAFEPTEHVPAGQPLPGVLISSLIGLCITGVAGIKKYNKRL